MRRTSATSDEQSTLPVGRLQQAYLAALGRWRWRCSRRPRHGPGASKAARLYPRGEAPSAERQLQGRSGDMRVRELVDDRAGGEHRNKFVKLAKRLGCNVLPTLTRDNRARFLELVARAEQQLCTRSLRSQTDLRGRAAGQRAAPY